MKEEQKIYIQGNQKRGDEIIKILANLGGDNSYCNGKDDKSYYFIDPSGIITKTPCIGGAICPFIKEFYKEIQLPRWKPKYKEHYYRINWKGAVVETTWYDTQDEEICYEFGNCFRTPEEAEAARDKIKEILKQ